MNDPYLTDDFHPLHLASTAILSALRSDESSPDGDLYKRLVSGGNSRYFDSVNGGEGGLSLSENTTDETKASPAAPSSHLLYSHSTPLPPPIVGAMANAKISSFMGLATEANLVWVACDGDLFLWRHGGGQSDVMSSQGGESDAAGGGTGNSWGGVPSLPRQMCEDVCSFSVPSGQCVVGVGVVRPKKGEFRFR